MFIISRGAGPSSGGMNNLLITEPNLILFYVAAIITMIELTEEIILVSLLKHWKANVKGIYWVLKEKAGNYD